MLLVPQLLWTRLLRSLPGILLISLALLLGPTLGTFLEHAPILDADRDLVTPWMALMATLATSTGVWGLQGLSAPRRVLPLPALWDSIACGSVVLVTLLLAGGTLSAFGFPVPWAAMPLEAVRMGALGAVLLALLPEAPRLAPALVWLPAWLLPSIIPFPVGRILAPFATPPLATLAAGLAVVLVALNTGPHALRDPR